jgi:hypothetical protein
VVGYSPSWCEGNDTLVVETTNFRGDEKAGWLDVNGGPYTDALKMTERRRPTFGSLGSTSPSTIPKRTQTVTSRESPAWWIPR